MTGPDDVDEPPGLQAERTELAWIRTALASAALAALASHMSAGGTTRALAVGGSLAIGAIGVAAGALRIQTLRAHPEPGPPPALSFALLTGAVVLADAVALLMLLADAT